MGLPERVRVKLSSEAAEAISITRVVVQELPLRELVEHLLVVAGKDAARIRELLQRGTVVNGASRFRWEGWPVDAADLDALLRTFPDAEPARPFAPALCERAILRGGRLGIEIPREAAARRGWFRRASFWDRLMEAVAGSAKAYREYSYRARADVYEAAIETAAAERLRDASTLLRYATLREQVRRGGYSAVELYTARK